MDINDLRSLATVLVFVAFLGVCIWAFSPSRRKQFNEAAQLPFADEPLRGDKDPTDNSHNQG
jgi:cytochrome c oxidase cbb3-type subunit IV